MPNNNIIKASDMIPIPEAFEDFKTEQRIIDPNMGSYGE